MYDIVYILNNVNSDELRKSLESIEKFPHGNIWFYHKKKGVLPWEQFISAVAEACKNKAITQDFWLFDDAYIMESEVPAYYDRTLYRKIQQGGGYQLRRTRQSLQSDGYKTKYYETPKPMLINIKKAEELIAKYPKMSMFKTTYGNVYDIGGEQL